jgi:diacylglycerol kinase (ATP)
VTIDGERQDVACTLVAVANTPVFGGGLIVSPVSTMTDGFLEVVLADPLTKLEITRLFPKLYDGSHLGDPRVRIVKATTVELAQYQRGATLPVAFADGERVGAEPLTVGIAPGALAVLGGRPK